MVYSFSEQVAKNEISQRPLDKCSQLFICMSSVLTRHFGKMILLRHLGKSVRLKVYQRTVKRIKRRFTSGGVCLGFFVLK